MLNIIVSAVGHVVYNVSVPSLEFEWIGINIKNKMTFNYVDKV